MDKLEAANDIIGQWLKVPDEINRQDAYQRLVTALNNLIRDDFPALVQLLYRLDVSEAKLRAALEQSPETDAAEHIARLIADRIRQREQDRARFSSGEGQSDTDDEERW